MCRSEVCRSYLVFFFVVFFGGLFSGEYSVYKDKYAELAQEYAETKENSWRYLSYRDLPELIQVEGLALDYGCGTGFSTRYLRQLGLETCGVDVSVEMLEEAVKETGEEGLFLIEHGELPFPDQSFDLVFSSWVLLEMGSHEELIRYLSEAKRVLKEGGQFLAIVDSEQRFSGKWCDMDVDYLENENLKSGDLAFSFDEASCIEFVDYYWTEQDYRECMEAAGMEVCGVHLPLGKPGEPYEWVDEKEISPILILLGR